MSLFAAAAASRETHLVEFNAGKCIIEGSWVKPDMRKGKVYMDQGDDQLLHFYWSERKPQSPPEDDLIIFPEEAVFTKVSQCTSGRVYLLRVKTSNEHHFYWMQSKNEENDEELVNRVNELIRDPEANMNNGEMDDSASHAELMRLLNGVESQDPNITPENLIQFLNNISGAGDSADEDEEERDEQHDQTETRENENDLHEAEMTEASAPDIEPASVLNTVDNTVDTTNSAGSATEWQSSAPTLTTENNTNAQTGTYNSGYQPTAEQLQQMREILANFGSAQGIAPINLNDVLTTQTLMPLINDTEICASLFPFIPEESERSPEEVRQIIRSPQFSQALQSLSGALQTGQLGPLLMELGLPASAGNGVEAFLKAISDQAKNKRQHHDAMDEA